MSNDQVRERCSRLAPGWSAFVRLQRDAFEAWQGDADETYQRWMTHPAFLDAGRRALELSLGLVAATRTTQNIAANALPFPASVFANYLKTVASLCRTLPPFAQFVPQVAATPAEIIYRENKLRLLHYRSASRRPYAIPILILGSLVNKYYILDLLPGRSYVEYLVQQGFDVYLVDWGEPDGGDAVLSLADYLSGYIPNAVRAVLQHAQASELSLVGYSMGGVLALVYSALDDKHVRNLVLLATPVDFAKAGALSAWTSKQYFDVDRFVETFGNVPAEMIYWSFRALRPASNATRAINLLQHVDNREELMALLALEQWLADAVSIPGTFYRDFVKAFYHENRLVQDALSIKGRAVRLKNVTCAVLNVIGTHDQTVPPECSTPLAALIGSKDKEELLLPYGHVTLTVHANARDHFWAKSSAWLKQRSGATLQKKRKRQA